MNDTKTTKQAAQLMQGDAGLGARGGLFPPITHSRYRVKIMIQLIITLFLGAVAAGGILFLQLWSADHFKRIECGLSESDPLFWEI